MVVSEFPPLETADPNGLLAFGGDLDPETLILAYSQGIFPWPYDEGLLAWYAPPQRAVLFLSELHIPRSLRKFARTTEWTTQQDRNLDAVIRECGSPKNRGNQKGTWITKAIRKAYCRLGELELCHSFECYDTTDTLIGGLYGIHMGRMFAGESMFYRQPNASKLAFLRLIDYLTANQVEWIDCQMMTPLFRQFGAREIPRSDFSELLNKALQKTAVALFLKSKDS
jgi:leucyl/phenylalanyl-tRNA---protein transferase